MNSQEILRASLFVLAMAFSLAIHEAAHAWSADRLGDPTARRLGRLTLNPLAHLDQLGTMMLLFMAFAGWGIGWGIPVPVDPRAFRNPRRDMALVAVAGPVSNLLQAVFAFQLAGAIALWVPAGAFSDLSLQFLDIFVLVNLVQFLFNLIPLYPLDGSKVMGGLLRGNVARRYDFMLIRGGSIPLVVLVLWEFLLPFPGPIGIILHVFLPQLMGVFQLMPHFGA